MGRILLSLLLVLVFVIFFLIFAINILILLFPPPPLILWHTSPPEIHHSSCIPHLSYRPPPLRHSRRLQPLQSISSRKSSFYLANLLFYLLLDIQSSQRQMPHFFQQPRPRPQYHIWTQTNPIEIFLLIQKSN